MQTSEVNEVTDADIRALRYDALCHGDDLQADLCSIALGRVDSDGTGTVLGKPCTAEAARAECTRVIRETRSLGQVASES